MPARAALSAPSLSAPLLPRSIAAGLLAALLTALGAGCMRSAPLATEDINCAPGALVVVEGSALCVYRPPDVPLECPEALPNRFERDGAVVCVRQSRPAGGLIERAVERVLGSDGGIFIVDAGLDPTPTIVDAGGATGADF